MPIVVHAMLEADYRTWVNEQKKQEQDTAGESERQWEKDELMGRGEEVYGKMCAACHQPDGQGMPPAFPALKGSPVVTGPLDKHVDVVMNGRSGTAMQGFASQLSDADLAAVITYKRNSWGNDTGDVVQPADINALRQQTRERR